jgi:hypothetical protein
VLTAASQSRAYFLNRNTPEMEGQSVDSCQMKID